ncbi:hypothetical protein [Paraflavitalea speifideaquila]|uniref:hypothetical protein n=1 Tax=Paraflavitalea speifideaquila TaxID=3076558 RepID=UPI0028E6B82E|nr:hypothetical protein [Paraflavitalea speifideiaquila]
MVDEVVFGIKWDLVSELEKKNFFRPFFVSFLRPSGMAHCILVVQNLETDLLHVVDSKLDEVVILSKWELIKNLHIISVDHLCLWNQTNPEHSVFMYKDENKHLFP